MWLLRSPSPELVASAAPGGALLPRSQAAGFTGVKRRCTRFFEHMHAVLRAEQANTMVEFCLVASILLLLLLGTLDYGRFLYYDLGIGNAAEVGLQTAMNPCAYQARCDSQALPQNDSVIMWSAYCEGQDSVHLAPTYSSCPPCSVNVCVPPAGASYAPCVQDICVSPTGTRTDQQQVQVTVGYNFRPMTVLVDQFFPSRSCYPGDSVAANHHTLCAVATGRVGDGA